MPIWETSTYCQNGGGGRRVEQRQARSPATSALRSCWWTCRWRSRRRARDRRSGRCSQPADRRRAVGASAASQAAAGQQAERQRTAIQPPEPRFCQDRWRTSKSDARGQRCVVVHRDQGDHHRRPRRGRSAAQPSAADGAASWRPRPPRRRATNSTQPSQLRYCTAIGARRGAGEDGRRVAQSCRCVLVRENHVATRTPIEADRARRTRRAAGPGASRTPRSTKAAVSATSARCSAIDGRPPPRWSGSPAASTQPTRRVVDAAGERDHGDRARSSDQIAPTTPSTAVAQASRRRR